MPFTRIKTYAVYCSLLGLLMLASGCASYHANKEFPSGYQEVVVVEDRLIAMGRPQSKAPAAKAANIDQSIAMVGEKYTYMINSGATEINRLVSDLDTKHIAFGQNIDTSQGLNDLAALTKPLTFRFSSSDNTFYGSVTFFYIKPANQIRSQEANTLQRLGFTSADKDTSPTSLAYYQKTIAIEGKRYNLPTNQHELLTQLTQQRAIQLTEERTVTSATRSVAVPAALAFDIITFPVQLLVLFANSVK